MYLKGSSIIKDNQNTYRDLEEFDNNQNVLNIEYKHERNNEVGTNFSY